MGIKRLSCDLRPCRSTAPHPGVCGDEKGREGATSVADFLRTSAEPVLVWVWAASRRLPRHFQCQDEHEAGKLEAFSYSSILGAPQHPPHVPRSAPPQPQAPRKRTLTPSPWSRMVLFRGLSWCQSGGRGTLVWPGWAGVKACHGSSPPGPYLGATAAAPVASAAMTWPRDPGGQPRRLAESETVLFLGLLPG